MKSAIYARVSTADKGQDPTMQTREMDEYVSRRGWKVYGTYVDSGVSGMKESRPELNRLMADARQRRFDAVIVYRYDRLSRSLKHLVNTLAEFDALGIQFISIHEGLDTTTPHGKLMFGIFASMAEFERNLIRERVISGIANARAKGKHLGRPDTTSSRAEEARGLRGQGQTFRAIGRALGISDRAVRRLCENEAKPLSSKAS